MLRVFAENKLLIIFGIFVDFWKYIDTPPTAVTIGKLLKSIPGKIRRIFRLICAERGIISVLIEIYAVVARMIENAVKYQADSAPFRFRNQLT